MNPPGGLLDPILQTFPLWAVGLIMVAACLAARAGGSFIYRRSHRGVADKPSEMSAAESHIIGAVFALLAFMIGLTFSIAVDRFDSRRGMVADEASAIMTTYLRASFFDEPHRERLHGLLRAYARSRVAPEGTWNTSMERQLRQSVALRDRIWEESYQALYPIRGTDQAGYYIEGVNEMLSLGTRRVLAGRAHIPTRVMDVLLLYLLVSAAVLGYLLQGKGGGRRHASTALLVLMTVSVILILDLDRPRSGTVQVPQRALEELVITLDRLAAREQSPPVALVSPL